MISIYSVPLLLTILIGLLLGLIIWGFLQVRSHRRNEALLLETEGDLQLWLLALAGFALGIFVTYLLFITIPL
jgi:CHASE1-domain containing sensor protein